jgi:hypothetical protein
MACEGESDNWTWSDRRGLTHRVNRDPDKVCGGPGGTRDNFLAENGFRIRKGSNHIGFELLLGMIAVSGP